MLSFLLQLGLQSLGGLFSFQDFSLTVKFHIVSERSHGMKVSSGPIVEYSASSVLISVLFTYRGEELFANNMEMSGKLALYSTVVLEGGFTS